MLPTHEVLEYMRTHRAGDYVNAAFDDPVMLQAELDGYAVREDGRWRGLGIIQPGEQRTVRFIYGGESVIVGTEEMRAECEAEIGRAA